MKPANSSTTNNFPALSVKDLIEARDMFHLHLMNKRNVIATAIGKYRLRLSDLDKNDNYHPKNTYPKEPRTLENSKVVDRISWPCVLVFVKQWQDESALIHDGGNNIIPKSIYMPDGRVVPICIVAVEKSHVTRTEVDERKLQFPKDLISGGFPLVVYSQISAASLRSGAW